jgi:hypothetical protein
MRDGNILKDQLPSGSLATAVLCLMLASMSLLVIQNPINLPCASFNLMAFLLCGSSKTYSHTGLKFCWAAQRSARQMERCGFLFFYLLILKTIYSPQ